MQKKTKKKSSKPVKKKICSFTAGRNQEVNIDCLEMHKQTQSRQSINPKLVEEYVEAMKAGNDFPPIEIVSDGTTAWVVDGWHRLLASQQMKADCVRANISIGNMNDAIWAAASANRLHGQRRSNSDKARAVMLALEAKPNAPVKEVAAHCGVSGEMIRQYIAAQQATEELNVAGEAEALATEEVIVEREEETNPVITAMSKTDGAIRACLRNIDTAVLSVKALIATQHGCYVNAQSVLSDFSNARSAIDQARPCEICPLCNGVGCKTCRETGWVTKKQLQLIPSKFHKVVKRINVRTETLND